MVSKTMWPSNDHWVVSTGGSWGENRANRYGRD